MSLDTIKASSISRFSPLVAAICPKLIFPFNNAFQSKFIIGLGVFIFSAFANPALSLSINTSHSKGGSFTVTLSRGADGQIAQLYENGRFIKGSGTRRTFSKGNGTYKYKEKKCSSYVNSSAVKACTRYSTSSEKTVVVTKTPGRPSSISVPSSVKFGEEYTVTWGEASGANRYVLRERYLKEDGNWSGWSDDKYHGSKESISFAGRQAGRKYQYKVLAYYTRSGKKSNNSSWRSSSSMSYPEAPRFSVTDTGEVTEGGVIRFAVKKTGATVKKHAVAYALTNGTADANDYIGGSGTLAFGANETVKYIDVETINDELFEPGSPETVQLVLSSPTNGAMLGKSEATGLIVSEDLDPRTIITAKDQSTQPVLSQGGAVDILVVNKPNNDGISFNFFSDFAVRERPLRLVNVPSASDSAGTGGWSSAPLIVIVADYISLKNKLELVGPAADIVFLVADDAGEIECEGCVIENALRVTLATAISDAALSVSSSSIGILTAGSSSSVSIHNLFAPGSIGVDVLARTISLQGSLETHSRALADARGGYTYVPHGDITVGAGQVNLLMGDMSWDYEKNIIASLRQTSGVASLGGYIQSSGVKISATSSLDIHTSIDTVTDIVSSVSYKKGAFIPQEGIDIQTFGYGDLVVKTDQVTVGHYL